MLAFLTGLTTTTHFLALLYIGFGGFLAWYWPGSFFVHVLFAIWGVAVNVFPLSCPLTLIEDRLRGLRGLRPLEGGFNEFYVYDTVFPREVLPAVGLTALGLVLFSYAGAYLRLRARRVPAVPGRTRTCGAE